MGGRLYVRQTLLRMIQQMKMKQSYGWAGDGADDRLPVDGDDDL